MNYSGSSRFYGLAFRIVLVLKEGTITFIGPLTLISISG